MSTPPSTTIFLTIPFKKTPPLDFTFPLRQYIAATYSELQAQSLGSDLQTLTQLRSDIERQSGPDTPSSRILLYQNYFKALTVIEARFPISAEKHHINTVVFTWHDAFKPRLKVSQQNIHLEKAAVLFNLGTVYGQLGRTCDRSSVEGRREAMKAFCEAAGAFAYLRDFEAVKASMGSSVTVDVSVECSGMLERLMLGQAQECVFENAVVKGSSNGVCAKISRQVGIYYEEALAALSVAPLNQHFDRSWISHVQLKTALFYAEACYRCGLELHEKEEIAEEITRLKMGISALTEARKSSKGAATQLFDSIDKLEGKLSCNLERAMKENDRVYLMRVPSSTSLPALAAFSLVKSMPMNQILDASEEKLFTGLVSDICAKALLRYNEMVDDIIRKQTEKLQQQSELVRVRLNEINVPDALRALDGNFTLPHDLKEGIEAVQISGGPVSLETELQQLRDLRRVDQELLMQTEGFLQKEAREDSEFRRQFGARWTRPQSSTLTESWQLRLNRFAGNLQQAAESDARIETLVKDHLVLLSILDRQPTESAIPTQSMPSKSLDANEDVIVGAVKQSLIQLETLGAQGVALEDMVKEMKQKDNILPKLMMSTGSYDDLFNKEITKYDLICEDIAQNCEDQGQLLLKIQAQKDDISAIFNTEDYKASREKSCKQIQAAIAKFQEIKENINEGMKFYINLQDAITNVKQQCSDFAMTRNIQCQEMIEHVQMQITGHSYETQRSTPEQLINPQSGVHHPLHPQTPYYHTLAQPPLSGPYYDNAHAQQHGSYPRPP